MALGAVVGCGSGRGPPEQASLTILYQADERLFGPYWSVEAWFLMFLPLVSWDDRGEIVPCLAQRWEPSPDYRRWTFHLRSDVRWHDGVPTTAHDVKFTIELQGRRDVLFDDAWHDVDSIAVPNDTTLVLHYGRPKNALNPWMVYWPKHLLQGLDPKQLYDWDFWTRPVGNGPYRYVRHAPKTLVELEANPDFYAGKPAIKRVFFKFRAGNAITELLSGNVDVLAWVNQADLPKLSTDPRFRVYYQLAPEVPWLKVLAWNHRHPLFADAVVRRALTAAIDRRELLRVMNLSQDLRLADVLYTPRQYRRGEMPPPIPYDPVRAQALLADADWRDTDGDRTLDRNGRPFRFTMLVGSAEDEAAAVYAQAAFRRIGVAMEVARLETTVLQRRLRQGEFDAAVAPFWNHVDGHIQWLGAGLAEQYRSPEMARVDYRNVDVARLLASARETVNLDERDRTYAQLAPLLLADVPVTFLFPRVQACVVARRVRGLESPYRADPVQFLEYLWLEGP